MQILGGSMAKSTVADHGPRSAADPITDSYSLTAVVVKWRDVKSGFYALATIYQDPGTRNLDLERMDLERMDLERTNLDINPGDCIRGRVLVPSFHDLDGKEDVAANVLLLRVLLKRVTGTSIALLRVKTSSK